MLKRPGENLQPDWIDEERAFLRDNLFSDQVARIFALAHVEFGRIDFGVINGRVQTWEINTNPMIITHSQLKWGLRRDVHRAFFEQFRAVLDNLIKQSPTVRPGLSYLGDQSKCDTKVIFERFRETAFGRLCERLFWKIDRCTRGKKEATRSSTG